MRTASGDYSGAGKSDTHPSILDLTISPNDSASYSKAALHSNYIVQDSLDKPLADFTDMHPNDTKSYLDIVNGVYVNFNSKTLRSSLSIAFSVIKFSPMLSGTTALKPVLITGHII